MPCLATDKYCTGCLACMDVCKHKAIIKVIRHSVTHVSVDDTKCVECGLCEKTCPIITSINKNKVVNMKAYGGWAKDNTVRIKAASGGIFSAIAKNFFHCYDKAAVVGANLENNKVTHIIIEKEEDIERLVNSKYIQSNTDGIYSAVLQKLKEGYEILFSGTPCQIAGLYGYVKQSKTNSLHTVELICHGIPGKEALDIALNYYQSKKIYSFRDKIEGQNKSLRITIDDKGKKKILGYGEKDIFHQIFSTRLLDRKSCNNCQYSSIERVADITIGDFWGNGFNNEDYQKGVSLVIANNEHGQKLLENNNDLTLKAVSLLQAINTNPNLYTGFEFIQYHPIALWGDFFRKILPAKIRLNIITGKMPSRLLWGFFKILTILDQTRRKRNVLKKYCK